MTVRPAQMGAGVSASSASPLLPYWTGHRSFWRAALWLMRKCPCAAGARQLLSWWWSAAMGICVTSTSPCSHWWKVRCFHHQHYLYLNFCRIFIISPLETNPFISSSFSLFNHYATTILYVFLYFVPQCFPQVGSLFDIGSWPLAEVDAEQLYSPAYHQFGE